MKKYRIKSYYNSTYIIEKRFWLFWWFPVREETLLMPISIPKIFTSINEARNYIDKLKADEERSKKQRYTEYL